MKIFVFARFLCRVFGTRPELEPSSLSHYWIHPHWRSWKSPKQLAHLFFPNVALLGVFYLDLLFAVLDSFEASAISTGPIQPRRPFSLWETKNSLSFLILIRFKAFMCAMSNKLSRSSTNSVSFSFWVFVCLFAFFFNLTHFRIVFQASRWHDVLVELEFELYPKTVQPPEWRLWIVSLRLFWR